MGLLGLFEKMARVEDTIDKLTPKVSLDTFMETVSDSVDKEILRIEQEQDMFFLGGKMHFSLVSDNKIISMNAEMYYQTSVGRYQKIEKNGQYPVSMLNREACESLCGEIIEHGEAIVEINKP